MISAQQTQVFRSELPTPGQTVREPSAILGKDDFLKLLIAQLRFQDPLSPMSNQEFIAQTAQFSSLEQFQNMTKLLEGIEGSLDANQASEASSLIGREIVATGGVIEHGGRGPASIRYTLSGEAANVRVEIVDSSGKPVRTLNLGPQAAGEQAIEWDGLDTNGRPVVAGTYGYRVKGFGPNGQLLPGTMTLAGVVRGVSFTGTQAFLLLDGGKVRLADVNEVRDVTEAPPAAAAL